MREIGVLEAKTRLSALLAEIEESGEPVIITRHGRPIARLSPERPRRRFSRVDAEALIKWREEVGREAEANGAEPFDWKDAAREGRE